MRRERYRAAVRSRVCGIVAVIAVCACHSAPPRPGPSGPLEAKAQPDPRTTRKVVLRRQTVAVDGHPVAVWEKRRGDEGQAIVIVHGRTWSSVPNFDLQVVGEDLSLMDAFVKRGLATYAIDLRGYGSTPRDASGFLTPSRASADLKAVLLWVQGQGFTKPPVVLGWSFGSLVSRLCAERDPELFSALVLYGYPRAEGWSPQKTASPGVPERRPTTRAAALEDFITPGSISNQAMERYAAQATQTDPVRADWTKLEEFAELDAARLTVPTLVIHGERDPYAPADVQTALTMALAAKRKAHVALAGADHAAHLEKKTEFVSEVMKFLASADGLGPPAL